MQEQNKNTFFEPKTLIAVAAVALTYFGWQTYLTKKYPNYGKPAVTTGSKQEETAKKTLDSTSAIAETKTVDSKSESVIVPTEVKTFNIKNEKVSYTLTSAGMGLKTFAVENFEDKEKNKIKLGVSDHASLFEMRLAGEEKPINFDIVEETPGSFLGSAKIGDMVIKRELKYNDANSSFESKVSFVNPTENIKNGFSLVIPEAIHTPASTSFLFPSYEHQDFFVGHNGKTETVNFSNSQESFSKEFVTTHLISVGSQYFASAILDKSDIIPEVKLVADISKKQAQAELTYKPTQLKPEMTFTQILYAGPKSIDSLKAVDPELAQIIDFGFFGFIARPLLYIMKGFHSFVGNWGFAIILLTLLVRFCVLPFNIMSMKSMKAMQKVQPAIQKIREKYKDDPMRLNQEMMATMKSHGANPMSSCLPMLLQIPIFFALYRVIGSSIELYHSPFIFWITDLSSHDRFYVLPVLMAIFMFIQQKMTPSTMDPVQAKIMLFLPLVFSLFMLQLPSGLTLYMVVSTLFGIIQQYILMRDTKSAT